jgi:hypothetical protein
VAGGEYAGVHVGAKLQTRRRRAEYYVGLSAGRKTGVSGITFEGVSCNSAGGIFRD